MKVTNYLHLNKPELTDAADITAINFNWDQIDSHIRSIDDITQIAMVSNLSQLELSDDEMSSTDFASNIDKLITNIGDAPCQLMLVLRNDVNPNLLASAINKLNIDANMTFDATKHFGWISIMTSGDTYRPVSIKLSLESEAYYDKVWTCTFNKESGSFKISKFTSNVEILTGTVEAVGDDIAPTHSTTISFERTPKIVFIGGSSRQVTAIYGCTMCSSVHQYDGTPCYANLQSCSWSGNTLTIDLESNTYTYVAFC